MNIGEERETIIVVPESEPVTIPAEPLEDPVDVPA